MALDESKYKELKLDREDRLLTITLNRPEARNALTDGMHKELESIWQDIAVDDSIGAIILTAAGDRGVVNWPLMMGIHKAKEYLLTGDWLHASEAERLGMINYAVPYEEVLPKAREIALKLANGPTWAIRWTKTSINKIIRDR